MVGIIYKEITKISLRKIAFRKTKKMANADDMMKIQ